MTPFLSRRGLLRAAAAVGGAAAVGVRSLGAAFARAAAPATSFRLDFASAGDGEGWPGWTTVGVANVRRENGEGILEAGSDIFPNDPRPVVSAVDRRMRDGTVTAVLTRAGSETGVVARRVSPRAYYAATLDVDVSILRLVRRSGFDLVELASVPVAPGAVPQPAAGTTATLSLEVSGAGPTALHGHLRGADGAEYEVDATDHTAPLQQPGDPGVLTRAETLFPSSGPVVPALGNLRLGAYGLQEGMLFFETPAGQALLAEIRRRSTAGFREIEVDAAEPLSPSVATVFTATTGAPRADGAILHVTTDLPAEVAVEVATSPDLAGARTIDAGPTAGFATATVDVDRLPTDTTVHWRARARRRGREHVGPIRSFRTPPGPAGDGRFTVAIAACGSQFNEIWDVIADRDPDLLIWQGDLNYPDTHGPLAQTTTGYAGIWRHFLDNPRTAPILEIAAFIGERDDHDYGIQDANRTNIRDHALATFDRIVNPELYQRLSLGPADVWILDQRLRKSDPEAPDNPEKTLLGMEQRRWLFETLATSPAPFKLICSPCTVADTAITNDRDGSWATGFTAERDLLLRHIHEEVEGQTLFLTGDTHLTMVYDGDDLFEARACPVDIPRPHDITIAHPLGPQQLEQDEDVVYSDGENHVSFVTVSRVDDVAHLVLELVRGDGSLGYRREFEQPVPSGRTSDGATARGGGGGDDALPATGAGRGVAAAGTAVLGVAEAVRRSLNRGY